MLPQIGHPTAFCQSFWKNVLGLRATGKVEATFSVTDLT